MGRIVIAAGHHAGAMGARYHGLVEHEQALEVRNHLQRILTTMGHEVNIVVGSLTTKCGCANEYKPDAAVEIHFNAGPPTAYGSECLYGSNPLDLALAEAIQARLVVVLGTRDRGVKFADYQGTPENDECAFTRDIEAPAVIVEPMFLSHAGEAKLLAEMPETHAQIARAVAMGIGEFLESNQVIK